MLVYILMFCLGASVGSFLNVVVMRTVESKSWVSGRSRCDHCHKQLSWYDMVPIFSYLLYRGRSRCCHKPLSIQYPIVELLVGALFVWWIAVGAFFFRLASHPLATLQPLYWLLVGVVLIMIAASDAFYGLIPTRYVYFGVATTLIYRLILITGGAYHWPDLGESVATAVGAYLFFYSLRKMTLGKGMGEGDEVLALLIGLILGWPKTLLGIWGGFVLGAVVGVLALMTGKKKFGQTLPFAPFMVLGLLLTLLWGEKILHYWG